MLRIGYARVDQGSAQELAELRALGCQVVRAEETADGAVVLGSILDFIGPGDQLAVTSLRRLATSSRGVLDVIERLEARGASLYIVGHGLSTEGSGARMLRAALEAVSVLDQDPPRRRRAADHEIRALRRAGHGPVEIARRLGVSRMTVWRKLKAAEA